MIDIDDLGLDDIDDVCRIERRCFSDPWKRSFFLAELSPFPFSGARAARVNGCLVGYCFHILIPDEEMQITNIAVDPDSQRLGIGQRLLDDAIALAEAESAERIVLEVRESNLPAIAFYQRNLFIQTGCRKRYYSGPVEDALLFERPLRHE